MFDKIDPEDTAQIEEVIRSGIISARKVMPYAAPAISAMQLRITKDLPTFAIDQYFRLYVNPDFVKKMVDEAREISAKNKCKTCGASEHHPIAYVAGILCHEAWHPLRKHMKTNKIMEIPNENFFLWNIAADLEINDDLVLAFKHCDTPRICLPDCVWLPEKIQDANGKKFQDNKFAAEYYYLLLEIQDKIKKMMQDGKIAVDMEPNGGEITEKDPGISDIERTILAQEIAEKIKKECSKNRGNVPGGFVVWADEELAAPKYNWRTELSRVVRHTIHKVIGDTYRTYRRLGRRSASVDHETVFPSTYSTKPNVTVIQDTSGSMGGGGDSLIKESMTELQGILKTIQASVTLISCDAEVHSKKSVSSVKGVQLQGGGGTDMTVGFKAAVETKPDVIILFTDGYTPWPQEEPIGIRCITVIVGQEIESNLGIPAWMKAVYIPKD